MQNNRIELEKSRKIVGVRLIEGFKQLIKKPWKNIFIAITVLLFLLLYKATSYIKTILPLPNLLQNIVPYIICCMYILICVLISVWTIIKIGTPFISTKIENSLAVAFTAKDLRFGCPVLISIEKANNTPLKRLSFYSKGISKEQWEFQREKIADALNVNIIDIQYGKSKNIIILSTSTSNYTNKDSLYDDLI